MPPIKWVAFYNSGGVGRLVVGASLLQAVKASAAKHNVNIIANSFLSFLLHLNTNRTFHFCQARQFRSFHRL